MCGRYMLSTDGETLAEAFELESAPEVEPRYNIAPSQPVLIVRGTGNGREAVRARWGLVPFWAEDPKVGYRMINARSETVAEKPAFRAAFRQRRCLVPASGYYEWKAVEGAKQPYFIFPTEAGCFGIAGLWERWQGEDECIESCTLLTCAANERLSAVHDRMPVVLRLQDYASWLDPRASRDELETLLVPAGDDGFSMQAVSKTVNSPRNDSPACIEPLAG